MLLEVFNVASPEEAVAVAKEVGYVLDETYTPVPMDRGYAIHPVGEGKSWILRGERGEKTDPRIKEWSDGKQELCGGLMPFCHE